MADEAKRPAQRRQMIPNIQLVIFPFIAGMPFRTVLSLKDTAATARR
jgi:hypothetical protein